jgi:hypothetical protein
VNSINEATRTINNNGLSINNVKMKDPNASVHMVPTTDQDLIMILNRVGINADFGEERKLIPVVVENNGKRILIIFDKTHVIIQVCDDGAIEWDWLYN